MWTLPPHRGQTSVFRVYSPHFSHFRRSQTTIFPLGHSILKLFSVLNECITGYLDICFSRKNRGCHRSLLKNCLDIAVQNGTSARRLSQHGTANVAGYLVNSIAENQLLVTAFGTFHAYKVASGLWYKFIPFAHLHFSSF